jgi:hypothetical protein
MILLFIYDGEDDVSCVVAVHDGRSSASATLERV